MAADGVYHLMHQRNRRPRVFRDRNNPLLYLSDTELIERYRFPRAGIEEILSQTENDISPRCARSHPLDATTKIRKIYGAASFVSYQTTQIDGIPNVIGAVDGTLVPILAPSEQEQAYVCRKGYHALNVQAVVAPDLRFIDVVAKWPGSSHDATVFENSGIKAHLENINNGWLLGDSGYPLKKYLITPKLNPRSEAEVKFNGAHSKTRIIVERAFGVLKSRFRCLHKTGRGLPFSPAKSCHVTEACMRLHNKCFELGIPLPDVVDDDRGDFDDAVFLGQENLSGQHIRDILINNFT